MKSTELRIGNWVERLSRYRDNHIQFEKVISLDENDIYGWLPSSFCRPIPLTEEILLNCGFEESGFYWWNADKTFYLGSIVNKFYFQLTTTKNNQVIIKSLHQLQNLYHVITGKELEGSFKFKINNPIN